MKKNKIAFTLVELIVVTLLMTLLTSSSVFYFFDFTDKREIIIQADLLQDDISDLDKQVKNFEISDYELFFTAGLNYYTGSINNLGTLNKVTLSSLEESGTGSFAIVGGDNELLWHYSLYEDSKKILSKITAASEEQEYRFNINKNYIIDGYITDQDSNTVSTNTILLKQLTSQDSGVELIEAVSGTLSNKNNTKNTLDLTFEKGGENQTITLK